MDFNGFKIFPCGNATLAVNDGVLRVSGISETGLDGILIETKGNEGHTINFKELPMIAGNNGVLKTSTLARNKVGKVVTILESFKWYDGDRDKIMLGYNENYLPSHYKVFGRINGDVVFEFDNADLPTQNDGSNAQTMGGPVVVVIGIIAIGVAVWAALRTRKTVTTTVHYDNQGHIVGYSKSVSEDPEPFEVEVNGEYFTVDEVGIKYDEVVAEKLVGNPESEYETIAEQITGVNLSSFEIVSITRDS